MSSSRHDISPRPMFAGSRRRGPAALVALALALSGAVGIGGPAVAAGPALVIDDFVAPTPANRTVELSGASLSENATGTRVSITPGGGSRYAEFTWNFSPPIDLTQGGTLTQMQLDYSNATGTDSAGNPLSNPIMMGLYAYDAGGGWRARGGTGVIPGSGKFVTNFTKQGDDDYRYLEGTGSLTDVSRVKLFVGTIGNTDTAAITVEWLAAVAAESAYTMPTFTGPTALDVQKNSSLSTSIAVTGYPRPTVTTSGSLPPGVTATTTGTTVTLSGAPTTVGEWDFTVHGYTLDWLTGSRTVHIRSFVTPTVTGTTTLRPQVGVPFSHSLSVGGEPLPTTATFSPPLPAGLSGTITGTTVTIAGTATDSGGPAPTTVSVGNGYATASLALDVVVTASATLPTLDDVLTLVDAPITPITITGGGYPPPAVTVSGLPTGLTATAVPGGREITGTPTATGTSTVTATATNGIGTPASDTFSLVVGTEPTLDVVAATPAPVGTALRVPITVTGFPAPFVTAGVDLPSGLTVSEDGDGWAIRGTPTGPGGPATVSLTASNGLGADATGTTVLTVTAPPTVTGPTTLDLPRGEALPAGVAFTGTGYPVPVMTLADGQTLPPGLTMTDDDGELTLSGTPTENGVTELTLVATSTEGTATHDLVVTVGSAPVFAEDSVAVGVRASQTLDTQLTASSWPAHTVAITAGTLPPGMTLTTDGHLFGRTGSLWAGRHELTVQATNAFGSDTLSLTLDILTPPNIPGGLTALTATAGTPVTYSFETTGWDPPTVTALDPLPDGLTLTQSADHTWQVSGTPTRDGRGSRVVQLELTNDYGTTVPAYLVIHVLATPVWDQPNGRTIIVERGEWIDPVPISATGYHLAGLLPSTSAGLEFSPGSWDYTAFTGWITGKPTGSGHFSACIYDASFHCYGPTLVTWFVVQDRPVIDAPASVTYGAGEHVSIPVTVTGSPAATLEDAGLPASLSMDPTGTGAWTITGTPDRTELGEHTITLTADNGLTRTATIALTITGPPEVSGPVTVTTPVGVPLSGTAVAATGYPLPVFSVVAENLPPGVSTYADGSGGLAFTGTPTTPGRWDVTVTATNTHGSDSATVAVEVLAAPGFTETLIEHTLREGDPVDFTADATGYPAPVVEVASGVLPAGLTLSTSGRITGTPTLGSADAGSGRYELELRAWNTEGEDTVPVTLVVLSQPGFPAGLPTMSIDTDTEATYTFTAGGWDRPTATLLDPLPEGLSLAQVDETTWQITGSVTRDERGPNMVRVALDNAFGQVVQTLRIDVHAALVWGPAPTSIVVETGVPITPLFVTSTGYAMPGNYGVSERPSWIWWPWYSFGETDFAVRFEGTPTTAGPARLTLTPLGVPGPDFTVTFLVTDRPVIAAPAVVTTTAGDALAIDVTVAGSPTSELTATGLPTGLALEPGATAGTWQIIGTPLRDVLGDHTVTLTAENGLTSTHDMTLTVIAGALLTTPTTAITTRLGEPMAPVTWTASGYPAPDVELVGTLPPGVHTAPGPDGVTLSGTPTTPGTWEVVVRATNAHGTDEVSVTITVEELPTFADPAVDLVMIEGVPTTVSFPLRGFPFPTVDVAGTIPGMTLTHVPGSDPVLSGAPAAGSAGDHTLTITARSTIARVEQTDVITITIRVDAQPQFRAGTEALVATVGTPTSRTVLVTGAPEATVVATGLPAGLALTRTDVGTWALAGTPVAGAGGCHTATLTAGNGVLDPVTAELEITVREPIASLQTTSGTLREGVPATVDVTTRGGWPTVANLRVDGALPAGVRFVDNGDGTGRVVGTPAAGTAGRWAVTLVADNGVSPTRMPVVLTVASAMIVGDPVPGTDGDGDGDGSDGSDGDGSDGSDGDGSPGDGDSIDSGADGEEAILGDSGPEVAVTVIGDRPSPWWWVLLSLLLAPGVYVIRRRMQRA